MKMQKILVTSSTAGPASISTSGDVISGGSLNGSVRITGTGTRNIMFRVKGPSMNTTATKLANPDMQILTLVSGTWNEILTSTDYGTAYTVATGYTDVTSTYASRHTGNNLEPMVVLQVGAGTYGAVVTGGTGRAIIEIYDVTDE